MLLRSMSAPFLERLFGSADRVETFLRERWPSQFFITKGDVARLDYLHELTFEELFRTPCTYRRAYFRTLDGSLEWTTPEPSQLRDFYESGFTMYFHGMRAPGLDAWREGIDEELGLARGMTRISGFASRRSAGLPTHYDGNDNIVIQLRGTKRWRLAENRHVKHPTVAFTLGAPITPEIAAEAPNGFPSAMPDDFECLDATPGTVMFVPRGTWHDTSTTEHESLHVNIQTGLPTWKDVAEFLATRTGLFAAAALRAPIDRRLFSGDRLDEAAAQKLRELLLEVVENIDPRDLISEEAFERYIAQARGSRP